MVKGQILTKILEFLENEVIDSNIDFIDAILSSGYGASMGKIEYEHQRRRRKSEKIKEEYEDYKIKRNRLNKFLYKLKNDGLIKEVENEKNKFILTKNGKNKLKQIKGKISPNNYAIEKQEGSIIISFDIPEGLRKRRSWLREVLRNLNFKMIHQSFWVGNTKIPKQFIVDLEKMNILDHIEIFEISKNGSLNKIEK